jgi:hypothetical protein
MLLRASQRGHTAQLRGNLTFVVSTVADLVFEH